VIEDGGLFGDPDRVLRRHHITQRTDVQVLDLPRPPGVEHARIGPDFVAFGMQVMLDRRGAPHTHVVRGLNDVEPLVHHPVIKVAVAPDRPLPLAAGFACCGKHWIKLQDDFRAHGPRSSIGSMSVLGNASRLVRS